MKNYKCDKCDGETRVLRKIPEMPKMEICDSCLCKIRGKTAEEVFGDGWKKLAKIKLNRRKKNDL